MDANSDGVEAPADVGTSSDEAEPFRTKRDAHVSAFGIERPLDCAGTALIAIMT